MIPEEEKETMILETDRLRLRPFLHEDLELIKSLYGNEQILRYTPFDTMTADQAEQHLEQIAGGWGTPPGNNYEMAVLRKDTQEKIGRAHIAIDPETDTGMIGWFLMPEHWGQGYAAEMTPVLIDCCFDRLHLHRVNAVCHPENVASWRTLEKCGMRREALLKKKCRYEKHGRTSWEDELEYAILASERRTERPERRGSEDGE